MHSAAPYRLRLRNVRSGAVLTVVAAHGLAFWALSSNTTSYGTASEWRSLAAVLILTNNPVRASTARQPSVRNVVVLQDLREPVMSLPAPPDIRYSEPNAQAVSVAPQLLDANPPDMVPFARRAGLRPGESVVIVLRVEVLPSGHVGQVEVDVSSGSPQADAAAMDYVRALAWVPGRLQGIEESTWVRQGVRLVA